MKRETAQVLQKDGNLDSSRVRDAQNKEQNVSGLESGNKTEDMNNNEDDLFGALTKNDLVRVHQILLSGVTLSEQGKRTLAYITERANISPELLGVFDNIHADDDEIYLPANYEVPEIENVVGLGGVSSFSESDTEVLPNLDDNPYRSTFEILGNIEDVDAEKERIKNRLLQMAAKIGISEDEQYRVARSLFALFDVSDKRVAELKE